MSIFEKNNCLRPSISRLISQLSLFIYTYQDVERTLAYSCSSSHYSMHRLSVASKDGKQAFCVFSFFCFFLADISTRESNKKTRETPLSPFISVWKDTHVYTRHLTEIGEDQMNKVFISRQDGNISWGFRLQGGLEDNQPLTLTHVSVVLY